MTSQIKELTEAQDCKGLSVRTTNIDETSHDTANLGRLWQKFHQDHVSHLAKGKDIYGIYHNYESDDAGAFDVVACWKIDIEEGEQKQLDNNYIPNVSNVVTVTLPAGKYLVFSEYGNMPNTVLNAWEQVWDYFNAPRCEHTRVYDVEYGQVDVYIGIE